MVNIVSDSSTLYTIKQARNCGFYSLPLHITTNLGCYKDYESISSRQLMDQIELKEAPVTSQPSLGHKVSLYEHLLRKGDVLDITLADGLSGTYSTACLAAAQTGSSNITVFNSQTLCGPQRYMTEQAVRLAGEGKSREEIIKALMQLQNQTDSYLLCPDFSYLKRGGRLKGYEAGAGKLLRLILSVRLREDGQSLEKFSVNRTWCANITAICTEIAQKLGKEDLIIYICDAQNKEKADKAEQKVREFFPSAQIVRLPLSPAFLAQGGPGCVSIQAIRKLDQMPALEQEK